MTRIVITGVGPVSALGVGRTALADQMAAGSCAIRPAAETPADGPRLTAAIEGFSVEPYLKGRKAYLDRASEFALAATALALSDAGLDGPHAVGDIGLMLGTAYGNIATMALYYQGVIDKGPQAAKPVLFPHLYANTAASLTAIEFDLGGPHAVVTSGWNSGAAAMLQAADWIAAGQARTLVAGGIDALHPLIVEGLWAAKQLSPLAGEAGGDAGVFSFDRRANGVVLGEGGGVVVLESAASAIARGARVLGELRGAAIGSIADGEGAARVMRQALARAGTAIDALGWVCAHGAGDPRLDRLERDGLALLASDRSTGLPVWTPAPWLGEPLAAGPGLRVALALAGVAPACRHYPNNLTGACDDGNLAGPAASPDAGDRAAVLINALDPGGTLISLVVVPGDEVESE